MINRWNAQEYAAFNNSLLSQRVYSSRLLGSDAQLVLHGGGNTSVKIRQKTFLGDEEDILYVKGSGGDLGTITEAGFAPVKMSACLKLAEFQTLSDSDMVKALRANMLEPDAPTPSIEAIVHAVIPGVFVDHTHANAVVALTNLPTGPQAVAEVYGSRVIIIPYVMPGFILAKTIRELTKNAAWDQLEGLILLNHGIFTFGATAQESYERMIRLVAEAETYLAQKGASAEKIAKSASGFQSGDLQKLASLRLEASKLRGKAVLAKFASDDISAGYAARADAARLSQRGPLTPDHTIRTKRLPALIGFGAEDFSGFSADYTAYFQKHRKEHSALDAAPRWVVWKDKGTVSFGTTLSEVGIVHDITQETLRTQQLAEAAGGWNALSAADLFEIEYWELEQAKLRKSGAALPLQGKVAIVSGAAAGIGRAIAQTLNAQGAVVYGLDLNPAVTERLVAPGLQGVVVNLTQYETVQKVVEDIIQAHGGLDILVSNAGIFTAGANFEDMDPNNWAKSLEVNLTSHMRLLQICVPYLKLGVDPTAIFIGSRNVRAPGAGAGSYSCAKAAVTQLVRVAALELAPAGVRVNMVHPDAVFDTELWTPEALARSAERYGLTVEQYKTRNLMKTEIKSADVANMVCTMAGSAFAKTTGAQIPIDGGNDRTI